MRRRCARAARGSRATSRRARALAGEPRGDRSDTARRWWPGRSPHPCARIPPAPEASGLRSRKLSATASEANPAADSKFAWCSSSVSGAIAASMSGRPCPRAACRVCRPGARCRAGRGTRCSCTLAREGSARPCNGTRSRRAGWPDRRAARSARCYTHRTRSAAECDTLHWRRHPTPTIHPMSLDNSGTPLLRQSRSRVICCQPRHQLRTTPPLWSGVRTDEAGIPTGRAVAPRGLRLRVRGHRPRRVRRTARAPSRPARSARAMTMAPRRMPPTATRIPMPLSVRRSMATPAPRTAAAFRASRAPRPPPKSAARRRTCSASRSSRARSSWSAMPAASTR